MLIPKFTIRLLLLVTTVCAFFFLVVSLAAQGKVWAIAVSLAIGSVVMAFLLYGALFGLAFVLASIVGALRIKRVTGMPFATSEPPPQIVPPQEPEAV